MTEFSSTPGASTGQATHAGLKKIMILGTGGTIAGAGSGASDSLHYRAAALDVGDLLQAVPPLAVIADIEAEQFAAIDSKDASLSFWCALSERINTVLERDDIAGVVVTHGTDTLEETAYWLQLTIASTKPVVLTAAMRPASALSADGPANLFDAVTLCVSPQAVGQGVLVTLGNGIYSARDVAKVSSHAVQAFAANEMGLLGWVQDGNVTFSRSISSIHTARSRFARSLGWQAETLSPVEILMSYGGVSRCFVDAACAAGVRGIVVAGTGNGTLHHVLQAALADAARQGIAVVRSSRVASVRVTPNAALDDQDAGFIASGTLTAPKARILLMLALSSGVSDVVALREIFARY